MLLWFSFAKVKYQWIEIWQKSENCFKVWNFWMIQNFTHSLGERWGSKLIGFRMIFPTLIFNRSLSLIDSCFQRTVNFFTLYSPLSLLQTSLVLVCLFSILVCYAWVLAVFFSLSITVIKSIWYERYELSRWESCALMAHAENKHS